jgi:hypothetical protein
LTTTVLNNEYGKDVEGKVVVWFKAVMLFGWKTRAKDERSELAEPVSTKSLETRTIPIRKRSVKN